MRWIFFFIDLLASSPRRFLVTVCAAFMLGVTERVVPGSVTGWLMSGLNFFLSYVALPVIVLVVIIISFRILARR